MHLADAFIQTTYSIFRLYMYCQYVCSLGIEPTTFCAANEMLYLWATETSEQLDILAFFIVKKLIFALWEIGIWICHPSPLLF